MIFLDGRELTGEPPDYRRVPLSGPFGTCYVGRLGIEPRTGGL